VEPDATGPPGTSSWVVRLRRIACLDAIAAAVAGFGLVVILSWPLLAPTVLGVSLDPLFSATCHRLPERTLQWGGTHLPACSRCVGMWAGVLLASAAGLVSARRLRWWSVRWGALLLLVMLADWALGRLVLPRQPHVERALTGLLGGAGEYVLFAEAWRGLGVVLRRVAPASRAGR
jgi:uncharacterized membrane protein